MLLQWAFIFLIVAIIAGLFGFTGIAIESVWIAKILFSIFLLLFVLAIIFSLLIV
jgi:uncharacterized membrane protein YtjA (UPF0391 family)